jgi:hypothetical protein
MTGEIGPAPPPPQAYLSSTTYMGIEVTSYTFKIRQRNFRVVISADAGSAQSQLMMLALEVRVLGYLLEWYVVISVQVYTHSGSI